MNRRFTASKSPAQRAIAEEIRRICTHRGMSQYDLARHLGVSPGHLSDIITGRNRLMPVIAARMDTMTGTGTGKKLYLAQEAESVDRIAKSEA